MTGVTRHPTVPREKKYPGTKNIIFQATLVANERV